MPTQSAALSASLAFLTLDVDFCEPA